MMSTNAPSTPTSARPATVSSSGRPGWTRMVRLSSRRTRIRSGIWRSSGTRPCLSHPPEISTPRAPRSASSPHKSNSEPPNLGSAVMPSRMCILQCSQASAQAVPVTLTETNRAASCLPYSEVLKRLSPGVWNTISSGKCVRRRAKEEAVIGNWRSEIAVSGMGGFCLNYVLRFTFYASDWIHEAPVRVGASSRFGQPRAANRLLHRRHERVKRQGSQGISPASASVGQGGGDRVRIGRVPAQAGFQVGDRSFGGEEVAADEHGFQNVTGQRGAYIQQAAGSFDFRRAERVRHSRRLAHPLGGEIFAAFERGNRAALVGGEIAGQERDAERGGVALGDARASFAQFNLAPDFAAHGRDAVGDGGDFLIGDFFKGRLEHAQHERDVEADQQ